MKQVFQNPKSGKTKVEEITPPALKSGGILARTKFSLISPGTERNIISISKSSILQKARERPDYVAKFLILVKTKGIKAAWQTAKSKLETDIALGYSLSGVVEAVSPGVSEFRAGDRVACAGQNYASHAEVVFVPKNLTVKIPSKVSDEEAAFTTVGAIVLQGIRRAELSPGESVAVIGLGLLGQIAVKILKAYGHPVIALDVDKKKVVQSLKNGADKAVIPGENHAGVVGGLTQGRGADAVLIYASSRDDAPLKVAVEIAREKGRIVQIGNVLTNIPWRDFYKKELDYRASCSYGPGRYDPSYEEGGNDYPAGLVRWTEKRNMEEFLRLLGEKLISLQDLITKIYPIEEAEDAYKTILSPSPESSVFGILLKYNTGKEQKNYLNLTPAMSALTPQEEVTAGIIGLGSFAASTILPHLKELNKGKSRVKILALASATGKKAKETAGEWGAEYITNDWQKIINDKRIDLVICATRHGSHGKIAEEALKADKNLYIEKPLALNEADLKRVIKAAEASKGRLLVGFNRRFSVHFKKAKELFAERNTSLVALYRVNMPSLERDHWSYKAEEGGRLLGEACHFTDALNFLIGSKPSRVKTSGIPLGGAIANEENFTIAVEYEDGSLGTILYTALGNFKLPKEYIEIYADGKIMIIDNFKNGKIITPEKTEKISLWHQNKGYTEELEEFVTTIKEGMPSPMSLEDIWYAHLAIFKAGEALRTGETVKIG